MCLNRSPLGWEEPHSEHHITETPRSTQVVPFRPPSNANNRIDPSSSFVKYLHENTSVSFRFLALPCNIISLQLGSKWDRLLVPIKEPLSSNITNDQQVQLAASIFKLVSGIVSFPKEKHQHVEDLDFTLCQYL